MANTQVCSIPRPQARRGLFSAATIVATLTLLGAAPGAAQSTDAEPSKNWEAEVALGASLSTGNTDRKSVDVDAKASHRAGRFEDHYKLSGEFARESGSTTASRVNGGVQSNYDITDRFYALGFAEVERDRFSGFRYETEVALGVGYRVIDTDDLSFDVELAPGYRHGAIRGGGTDNKAFIRGSALLNYKISDTATLTNEATVSGESGQVRAENTLALTATVVSDLAARLSFNIRYNSNPPAGAEKTDTISKAQLVYAF